MLHPSIKQWQKKLKNLMNELDDFLEDNYSNKFRLHPARQKRGKTSNKAQDGLFNIVANFSLGTGSDFGRGYIVDVHISTLENVSEKMITEIKMAALEKLRERISVHFPNKKLFVDLDGDLIKIHGNLNLGEV